MVLVSVMVRETASSRERAPMVHSAGESERPETSGFSSSGSVCRQQRARRGATTMKPRGVKDGCWRKRRAWGEDFQR